MTSRTKSRSIGNRPRASSSGLYSLLLGSRRLAMFYHLGFYHLGAHRLGGCGGCRVPYPLLHLDGQLRELLGDLVAGVGLEQRPSDLLGPRHYSGAADGGVEHAGLAAFHLEQLVDFRRVLPRESDALIESGDHHTQKLELRVEFGLAGAADVLKAFAHSVEGEAFRDDGDQEPVRSHVGCDGRSGGVGGGVQEDVVVLAAQGADGIDKYPAGIVEAVLGGEDRFQLLQIAGGWDEMDVFGKFDVWFMLIDDYFVGCAFLAQDHESTIEGFRRNAQV